MSGLLNTALSGLKLSQTALQTTGHNIANANTSGYSRQNVEVSTNTASQSGAGFIGNGARVTEIQRTVDDFLITQLRSDTSLAAELQAFNDNIGQLDTLLSNSTTGLSNALNEFFSVVESAANDPTSIPSRQLVISQAESLAQRFNTLYDRVESISSGVNQKLGASVDQINALSTSVATLNQSIATASGGGDQVPNDLLDQRDEALRQLSELVSIDVVNQGDGMVNVSIGSGQSLVVGNNARQLELVDGDLDPQRKDIAYKDGSGTQVITNLLSGGAVGGLLEFRDSSLSTTYNEMGRVALVMSDSFNEVHSLGIDLNNQKGGLIFTDVNDPTLAANRVFGDDKNAAPDDRVMSVELVDSSKLTASDYVLDVSQGDTSYRITRQSDGAVVYSGALPGSLPSSVEFDGVKLNFTAGSFQAGDKFLIQPTKSGARDIGTVIERPDQLAFASPLLTESDSGNTGSANISAGSVVSLKDTSGNPLPLFGTQGEMSPPLLVQFTSPTTYDILDNSDPANPVPLEPPIRNQTFVPGQSNPLFHQDPGGTLVAANGSSLGITAPVTGASPLPFEGNGYTSERLTITYTDPKTGAVSQQSVTTGVDDTAKSIASQLSNIPGVTANARNSMSLSGFAGLTATDPLQVSVNGVNLVGYEAGAIDLEMPDPAAEPMAFNKYLADKINSDPALQAQGLYAVAGTNSTTGLPELRVASSQGGDLNVTMTAQAGESLSVEDYNNSAATLSGAGVGQESTVTIGGTLDVELAEGYTLTTNPTLSGIFGDSSVEDFAKASYLGIEANINGIADVGDRFTLDFNTDGVSDNRNALGLVGIGSENIVDGGLKTISENYSTLVEKIGIQTNTSNINLEAGDKVLEQTQNLRNSVSGVNLDEEAANLIQFEQIYNANAQVISVARDLFDRLIGIF